MRVLLPPAVLLLWAVQVEIVTCREGRLRVVSAALPGPHLGFWGFICFVLAPGLCRSNPPWRAGRFKPLQVQYLQCSASPFHCQHET